jgi:hypothetical protein
MSSYLDHIVNEIKSAKTDNDIKQIIVKAILAGIHDSNIENEAFDYIKENQ